MSSAWQKGGAFIRNVGSKLWSPVGSIAYGVKTMYALDKTPTLITFVTVVIAAAYVVFPTIGARVAGATLVLTATFVAIVWTAHYTYRSVKHGRLLIAREDRQRVHERTVLLDGVLADLDLLDSVLALPAEALRHASSRFLERKNIERGLERGHLLDAETAKRIADFQSALHLLERLILSFQMTANRPTTSDPEVLKQIDALMLTVRNSLPTVRTLVQEAKVAPL